MIRVLKFGGTSVGSAENMRKVAEIVLGEKTQITVLSAMSETTNGLVKICKEASEGRVDSETIDYLTAKYNRCVEELLTDTTFALEKVAEVYGFIRNEAANYGATSENTILAQGELLTTQIFTLYLKQLGVEAELISAPEFMRTNAEGMADQEFLEESLRPIVTAEKRNTYFVTQGFICKNSEGNLDNLGRGGSDYSAALFGAAIDADEVQIWTDIDGMHNNDPRYVEGTYPIRKMSFTEASELAYFGAKILHPTTILPCKKKSINVLLKNTMDPKAEGTLITSEADNLRTYHAVAAKDDITVIRICSARMLMAYGFLRGVFEVFEKYKTPIDMITTSEVAVSITIDNQAHLEEILTDLKQFGNVSCEQNNSIICVVGNIPQGVAGVTHHILDSVTNIPIKMISFGASENNFAFLVDSKNKVAALRQLNKHLFEGK